MARLRNPLEITGPVGGLSIYKRKDLDGFIVRTPGGANKKKIEQSPSMEGTWKTNAEFAGRSAAVKMIRATMYPLQMLADFNFTPRLNSLVGMLQSLDTTNPRGERAILLSKAPQLLEGFRLNRRIALDDILRSPLTASFDDGQAKITVQVPALLRGANFFPPEGRFTSMRFIACLAGCPIW